VEQSISTIRTQKDRITALVDDQQVLIAKNEAFLNDGKAIYKGRLCILTALAE